MKRALITGASSGIGRATAEKLAEAGTHLILVARRDDRLQSLKADLEKRFNVQVTTAAVDVQNKSQIDDLVKRHEALLKDTDILVNNAGLAKGTDKLTDGHTADWDLMIDTNVKGLLYMTRALLAPAVYAPGEEWAYREYGLGGRSLGLSRRWGLLCEQVRGAGDQRWFAHGSLGHSITGDKY